MAEHVFLVAVTVEAATRYRAEEYLHNVLPRPGRHDPHLNGYVEDWWIAEDDRHDRSDNDSAVFVPKGMQHIIQQALREARGQ